MKPQIPILDFCTLTLSKNDDVLVDQLSDYLHKHQNLVFPHRHNFYQLVIFTQGAGSHSIDFNTFQVTPWHLYFMSPGQVHTWEFEGEPDGYIINFNREFLQSFLLKSDYAETFSFFNGVSNKEAKEVPRVIREEVTYLCKKLYKQFNLQSNINVDHQRVLLLSLLMLLEEPLDGAQERPIQSHNFSLFRNFQKLIEAHYADMRLPKAYADLLFITANHLNAICKEFTGIPAGKIIRERVLLEAKRLLVSQDLSMSEIANQLNFNDNSYFTKFFKKQSGLTPEEFKKQNIRH
jgi:AraC family transcriptional activator of pobA